MVGDLQTAALVSSGGTIGWSCRPAGNHPPLHDQQEPAPTCRDPTTTPASIADPFGSYYVAGTAPLAGPLSFHVDYSGSGHYGPAAQTFAVPVAKYARCRAVQNSCRVLGRGVESSVGR
ncbi:hypothetical protein [Streptomyces mirabilis]|uniref:hypothetical protein n=1 Tax=Streptomyces mirabilis TaxID=68239 RepID=UPI0036BB9EEB